MIVGGGPVGLMSSIESYHQVAFVQVHEKGSEYRRNTWFDLEPRWSTSLKTLVQWGMNYQKMEHVVHDAGANVITLRTQNLER